MPRILQILPHIKRINSCSFAIRYIRTSQSNNTQPIGLGVTNVTDVTSANKIVIPEWLVDEEKSTDFSLKILEDNALYISKAESSKFLVPKPKSDSLTITYWIYNTLIKSKRIKHVAITMNILSLAQIENQSLLNSLNIGPGFNMKLYFYTIHLWILHRRLIQIRPYGQIIDSELFDICWDIVTKWIIKKQGKSHLVKELQHVKNIIQLFCFDLDLASQFNSMIPTKIAQTLYKYMYIDHGVDKLAMIKLVKYIIRQFLHIQNLETEHFMEARFHWANYDEVYQHTKVFGQATPSILKYDGYTPDTSHIVAKQLSSNYNIIPNDTADS